VKENYYALLICIFRPVTPEQGFRLLNSRATKVQNKSICKNDIEDMIQMKQQKLTYDEIGKIYGLSRQAVYRRIKRYKEK
jgi:hypothetical protein